MRKHCPNKERIKDGTERILERFLWFPKRINEECRWLEKAKWVESSQRMWDITCGHEWIEWRVIKWLN